MSLKGLIKPFLMRLIQPSPMLRTDGERRRARLLIILLLPYLVNAFLGAVVTHSHVSKALWLLSTLLLIALALSKTRYAIWGALLAVVGSILPTFNALVHLELFNKDTIWQTIPWLAIPMILAAVWLPVRFVMLVLGSLLLGVLMLPLSSLGITFPLLVPSLIFLSIGAILATIGAWLTERDQESLEDKTHEAINAQRLLATVLDNVDEAVIVVDRNGKIISVNDGASNLMNTNMSALIGLSFIRFCPHEVKKTIMGDLKNIFDSTNPTTNYCGVDLLRYTGEKFCANLTVRQIQVNSDMHFMCIVKDLSEEKKLESMKSEFVATVSHELRTPLTSIRGALGLIDGLHGQSLKGEVRDLITLALSNSLLLGKLVDDILDLTKLESGKMEFREERVDLVQILRDTVSDNSPFAVAASVSLEIVSELDVCPVVVDSMRVRQVINNLLSNALKFSDGGKKISISLQYGGGGDLLVKVADEGPGIPDEFKKRIFEKFSQADTSDHRKHYGTGLGLSISRAIIEQMGGRIGFTTKQNVGSTFYFSIPASKTLSITQFPS